MKVQEKALWLKSMKKDLLIKDAEIVKEDSVLKKFRSLWARSMKASTCV